MDAMLEKALGALVLDAAESGRHKPERSEIIGRALEAAGLESGKPPPDFDGVYVYALIQYGAQRPAEVMQLFRRPDFRAAFRKSLEANGPEMLASEDEGLVEYHRVANELAAGNIDVHREVALFSAVFNEVADARTTPGEKRREQQVGAILSRLEALPDLMSVRQEITTLQAGYRARQFVLAPGDGKLKVFVSSRMKELRDVRSILLQALHGSGFDAFVYESGAGARPDSIEEASLSQVEATDIYLGIFDTTFGPVTIEEFRHARRLNKPCLVYIRDRDAQREPKLERFLNSEVLDAQTGIAPWYFDSATELAKRAADDILAWLVRQHRILSAQLRDAATSAEEQARLRKEVERLQSLTRDTLPEGSPLDLLSANLASWFRVSGYPSEGHELRAPDHCESVINVPDRERKYMRVLVSADSRPFLPAGANVTPLFSGDRGESLEAITRDEKTWPEWWQAAESRPQPPANHVPNPRFGKIVSSLVVDSRCEQLELTGIVGLDDKTREEFIERGAIYRAGALERLRRWKPTWPHSGRRG